MVPPSLPYAGVLGLAAVISGLLTVVGVRFRDEIGADWFAATLGLVTVWNALVFVGFVVDARWVEMLVEVVSTVVSISVPVVWFTFVLEYSGRGHLLTRRWLAALWAVPAVALASIATFPYHTLYFASFEPVTRAGVTHVEAPPGPVALLTVVYIYGLFLVGLWLVVRMVSEHDRLYAGQGVWLLAGSVVPIGVGLLRVFELVPPQIPVIPAGMALLGIAYGYGLYRHRLLDLAPATRRIGSTEALNDLDEGIVIVDREWDVVAINESACRQFDCEKSTVLGRDVGTVSADLEFDDQSEGIVDLEHDNRVLEVATSTVEDSRGRLAGYALVVRDVTVRRGRKQRLEVLNRILRHNLRNDMTVIKGYANEIAARADAETAEMADSIDANADGLLALAEKARAIERTITAVDRELRAVDLAAMVETAVADVGDEHRDAPVAVDVPDDLTVTTDAPTLELVLHNLVENAVQHGTRDAVTNGGDVGLAGTTSRPTAVAVGARRTDRDVEITVEDDGPGIPAAELAVIERGTETALEHCSGLGLWLVNWGATRIGADLTFDTTDGTTVTLLVPDGASE